MADFTTPRVSEKKFFAIPSRLFTADGTINGLVTVDSTYSYKVGQIVSCSSSSQLSRRLKIKRIISETEMYVGDASTNITQYVDMSAFLVADTATVSFTEQQRPVIDVLEIQRQVYEEEPTMALRSHLVDWLGRSYDKSNPIPVQLPDEVVIILPVGAATEAKQDAGNASLVSIDNKLDNLAIEAMTEPTNPDNIMIVGTLNGQKNSTKYGFVNNVRQQIIASHDRQQVITYDDFGNKNQRITKVEYASPTFPGITATKNITYSLVGNKYRRDSINWVIS